MTTQLAFPTDALANDLRPEQIAGVEAAIRAQEAQRARAAGHAAPCRCRRPWALGEDGHCCKCGRSTRREENR